MADAQQVRIHQMALDCGWTIAKEEEGAFVLKVDDVPEVTVSVFTLDKKNVSFSISEPTIRTILSSQFPAVSLDRVDVNYELSPLLRSAYFLCLKLGDDPVAEVKATTNVESQDQGAVAIKQIKEKIGTDVHQRNLFRCWHNKCALTGLDCKEMLVGVYSKPWDKCETDKERVDVDNGFLLEARYARLFEKGLITFDDKGNMQVSSSLGDEQKRILSIDGSLKLRKLDRKKGKYLAWHQANVFKN